MALLQSNGTAAGRGNNRTVEETYTKLSQLEHVLVRPDTYVGSVERMQQPSWVWDDSNNNMVHKDVTYPPGLYKIFDEILVNAADHAQRDSNMDTLKVEIDPENLTISVWNNGAGIPVEIHKKEKIYVPELIFGHLLTSSNYDDQEKKVVGGRNGFGAKLANIFSTEFIVETADRVNGKRFKQVFRNNMSSKDDPIIRSNPKNESYTKITFSPDLSRFGLTHLDDDVVSLMKKRVYDIAGVNYRLKVILNGSKINIKSFKDYVALYPTDPESTIQHERLNDRWEVAITASDGQLKQVSFVNSIWTIKGGTHVAHIADTIVTKIIDHIQKKNKGVNVKPFQVKSHLSLFVNCLIENPSFDSQTKETLTTKASKFGSKWSFSDELAKKVISKTTVVQNILEFARFKQSKELAKTDGGKKARVTGIPKLDDANKAGSKEASKCTLILTEGDSAKALAVSGLSVVGRDYFGVFPLRGKLLNVREAKHKQIMDNVEINHLKKIIGLQQNKAYDAESVKSLRYGHVLIMTDQDHDGSHIKGLVINFFDHFWPSLLRVPGFLQEFITPIVKCIKGRENRVFFTLPQYKTWVESSEGNQRGWRAKYYKGLGTSTAAEAKAYFSELGTHLHRFNYAGEEDNNSIELAFSKQRVNDRKDWLSSFQPGTFFNHDEDELNYSNFVNKELILFSVADNSRSIPNIIDGFKPSQRKVLFACFKRKLTKNEIKVAQLAGYVSEHAAYHHGEMSLQSTIVGLAQNFVGSNNVNLLVPDGQFGTRLQGGKDAASSRYIFTKLAPIARAMMPELDDPILDYLEEDGMSIEPKWYCPVIPLVLVNGSDGIGTGWSSFIPCYNPRDLINNIRRLLKEEPMEKMSPWYRGFQGSIVPVGNANSFDVYGNLKRGREENSFKIDELPIRSWTSPYKEFLETSMIGNTDAKAPFVRDFQDNGTENKVNFTFTTTQQLSSEIGSSAGYKKLKLSTTISTNNMVLFDAEGRIRRYETPEQIVQDFFHVRLRLYDQRRVHMLNELEHELMCLDNKQRFILMVIDGKLKVAKRKKVELIQDLKRLEFDPIVKKKSANASQSPDSEANEDGDTEMTENENEVSERDSGYDYLLSMPLWSLTAERVRHLQQQRDNKANQKNEMEAITGKELWEIDLKKLEEALVKDEEITRKQAADLERVARQARTKQKRGGGKRKGQKAFIYEESDGEDLEIVDIPSVRTVVTKVPRVRKAPIIGSKPKTVGKKRPSPSKKSTNLSESDDDENDSEMHLTDDSDGENDFVDAIGEINDGGISDVLADMKLEKSAPAPPARRVPRRAAKPTKIVISDGESEEGDAADDDDVFALDDDDEIQVVKKAPARKKVSILEPQVSSVKPASSTNPFGGDDDVSIAPSSLASSASSARLTAARKPPTGGRGKGKKKATESSAAVKRGTVAKSKASVETVDLLVSPGKSPMPKKKRVKSPAVVKKVSKASTTSKRSVAKKLIVDDDDDDDDDLYDGDVEEIDIAPAPVPAARASRPKRNVARKVTIDIDGSDDDDDDEVEEQDFDADDDSDFE